MLFEGFYIGWMYCGPHAIWGLLYWMNVMRATCYSRAYILDECGVGHMLFEGFYIGWMWCRPHAIGGLLYWMNVMRATCYLRAFIMDECVAGHMLFEGSCIGWMWWGAHAIWGLLYWMNVLSYVIHNSLSPESHDMGSAPLGVKLTMTRLGWNIVRSLSVQNKMMDE